MANSDPVDTQGDDTIEPYKLSEIFSIVPEYDGDPINLGTFTAACDAANQMCTEQQAYLLAIKIKNQLRGKAAQLINSRDVKTWADISALLSVHFGDPRDLNSLIQDLQRLRQMPNENALTFVSRIQTHNSKMLSAISKQNLTQSQKNSQIILVDNMCLNTLLTGLEPKLGQIIRASNPLTILEAINRIKRELQLSYFENSRQKPNQNNLGESSRQRNPVSSCNYCKKSGHTIQECRLRQRNNSTQNNNSFRANNNFFRPTNNSFRANNYSFRPSQNINNFSQPPRPNNPQSCNNNPSVPYSNNTNYRNPYTNSTRPTYSRQNINYHPNQANREFGRQHVVTESGNQPQDFRSPASENMETEIQDLRTVDQQSFV